MDETSQTIVLLTVGGSYALMLLLSLYFYFNPPKKINSLYGYRTPRSMKNAENWEYANQLSARYMVYQTSLATTVFLLSFGLLRDHISVDAMILGNMAVLCLSLLALIPIIESKLKKFEASRS